MNRALAIGVGLLYVLAPNRVVETAERAAFENPDDGRLRSWTIPAARAEGLVFCALALRGGLGKPLRAPLAVLGLLLAAAPNRMLAFGLGIAYENPEDLEVKSWVLPVTRLLGACYLVIGVLAGRAATPVDDDSSTVGTSAGEH